MEKIADGLFAAEEPMPCSPGELSIMRWAIPHALDRSEPEEAAARILSFSQEHDRWVGVSWGTIRQMMDAECALYQRIRAAKQHNFNEGNRLEHALLMYRLKCFFSLGVYRLFASIPTADVVEEPDETVPLTGIFVFGPKHVIRGVRELIDRKLVKRVLLYDHNDKLEVLFPTPALIERIMKAQHIATAPTS